MIINDLINIALDGVEQAGGSTISCVSIAENIDISKAKYVMAYIIAVKAAKRGLSITFNGTRHPMLIDIYDAEHAPQYLALKPMRN